MWHHQLPCQWSVHFSSSHLAVPARKKIGGKFFEDQVTTDPSFVFAPPDKLKEQLGYTWVKISGLRFWNYCHCSLTIPPKSPSPRLFTENIATSSYTFHELQSLFEIHPPQNRGRQGHMKPPMDITLNDEATTFKALCVSLGREDGRCFPGKNRYQEIGEDAWLASKFKCYWHEDSFQVFDLIWFADVYVAVWMLLKSRWGSSFKPGLKLHFIPLSI